MIEFLKQQPQEALVAYRQFSENYLLSLSDIKMKSCQEPRSDGWVHDARPDRETILYVVFPGN